MDATKEVKEVSDSIECSDVVHVDSFIEKEGDNVSFDPNMGETFAHEHVKTEILNGSSENGKEVATLLQERHDFESWGVNVQPYTCTTANFSVDTWILLPGDRIMGLDTPSGDNTSHGCYLPKGRKFWIKFTNQWIRALYSPFVAYEMAKELVDGDDAKVSICKMRKSVLGELKMHDSFVQEWAVDLPKESTPSSATLKYTEFLLETTSGKVDGVKTHCNLANPFEKTKLAVYTLGAMVPCMKPYVFLGKELHTLASPIEGTHPFKKWINKYACEGFQAAALQTEDLLDKLSVSLNGEEFNIIERLYNQAMKLETKFFLAHTPTQRIVVSLSENHNPDEHCLVLFSGFALTCTVLDSPAILAKIAIIKASKSDQVQSGNQLVWMSSADLRSAWIELSKQYTEEYEIDWDPSTSKNELLKPHGDLLVIEAWKLELLVLHFIIIWDPGGVGPGSECNFDRGFGHISLACYHSLSSCSGTNFFLSLEDKAYLRGRECDIPRLHKKVSFYLEKHVSALQLMKGKIVKSLK